MKSNDLFFMDRNTAVSVAMNSLSIPKLKFIYSEKAKKFCEIFTLLLSNVVLVKSKVKILQNFVAFSEYMNFKTLYFYRL